MPAKDFYHDTVKTALIKDGWAITDDRCWVRVTFALTLNPSPNLGEGL
ncbi:XisH family protein [Leptodesmis sichuanensis]|nr:hypothetical protein KIK02_05935 [Leptodesmis sichuanensis A121]